MKNSAFMGIGNICQADFSTRESPPDLAWHAEKFSWQMNIRRQTRVSRNNERQVLNQGLLVMVPLLKVMLIVPMSDF